MKYEYTIQFQVLFCYEGGISEDWLMTDQDSETSLEVFYFIEVYICRPMLCQRFLCNQGY